MSFKTPILFIIFNRPELTQKVFEAIREIKPEKLFVSADGPRANRPEDAVKCEETRKILQQIDWQCEVKTLFHEKNLGCGIAPYKAITWFFENVEAGIILEDDCVPSSSFFNFCDELLEYYKDNSRIMQISGTNFQNGVVRGEGSYYFSKYSQCWGWATWRRAWKFYNYEIQNVDEFFQNAEFDSLKEKNFWAKQFKYSNKNQKDVWDYQWNYAILSQNGLCITPNQNLISNVGFGDDATHTVYPFSNYSKMQTGNFDTIKHPASIERNKIADQYVFNNMFTTGKLKFLYKGCVYVGYKMVSFFRKKLI